MPERVSSGLPASHRLAVLVWALGLPVATAAGPAAPVADRLGNTITGTWASTTGAERLVFLPSGDFRSCFTNGRKGNAAMGRWKRLAPGRYAVEFTHTATPACQLPPQAIRQHPASILGQVLVHKGELSLYVSGEFPPDIYLPVPVAH